MPASLTSHQGSIRYFSKWLMFSCFALLTACATVDISKQYPDPQERFSETYYHVWIPSHDGVRLKATVYQPALKPGETAPVILSTHGFGTFRMPRPLSIYGTMVITGQASLAAWHAGYWVISYDQRGFGDSEGDVMLMSPEHEVRDVSAIIDWVEHNLPRVSKHPDGDLALGMIGESYGGGAQLMASIRDPRLKALVPITTWHDLGTALAPNGHVKSYWNAILMGAGTFSSGFDFGMAYGDNYLAMFSGDMNDGVNQDLSRRSPSHHCAKGEYPQADMLLLQGIRDTVFTLNHGYRNYQCAREGGRDARLIGIRDGHVLPWPTQSMGMPFYTTQDTIVCDEKSFRTTDMIVQWYNLKLKGIPEPDPIPELCVTLSPDDGLIQHELMAGAHALIVKPVSLALTQTGLYEYVFRPMEWLAGLVLPARMPREAEYQPVTGGRFRPLFLPLDVMHDTRQMVGIPHADLTLTTSAPDKDAVVLAALGVRRAGTPLVKIISEQFIPLKGDGTHQLELPAVAIELERGDTLGLVLQGYSGQYFFNQRGRFRSAEVSGQLNVPYLREDTLTAQSVVETETAQ